MSAVWLRYPRATGGSDSSSLSAVPLLSPTVLSKISRNFRRVRLANAPGRSSCSLWIFSVPAGRAASRKSESDRSEDSLSELADFFSLCFFFFFFLPSVILKADGPKAGGERAATFC